MSTFLLVCLTVHPEITQSSAISSSVQDYWPTDGWRTSSPEEQGIDSSLLDEMMAKIQENSILIDSLLIARHGYLVYEKYPRFYYNESRHIIHSCTKSYTSALVGIAIEEGYINSTNDRLVDLLPNRTIANLDERKESITLENLLTMTSGLEWDEWTYPYESSQNSLNKMWDASDTVQYVLDLPMSSNPGETWAYSSGGSHLLGAVVAESTGVSLFDYANDRIFAPLGISSSNVYWPLDNQGFYLGYGGVEMVPQDMLKFGLLYLNNGTWDGEQIVDTEWVQRSSETLVTFNDYSGYSYQWWTYQNEVVDFYAAQGFAGQFIMVIPELDMMVVFTSSVPPYETYPQTAILMDYIVPAALSEPSQESFRSDAIILVTLATISLPVIFGGMYYRVKVRNWPKGQTKGR